MPAQKIRMMIGVKIRISFRVRSGMYLYCSLTGPVKTRCNMVCKKTAVASRPTAAASGTPGSTAKVPLKIKNSAAKPAMNGSPSEQNVRMKNAAATGGVTALSPPKSSGLASSQLASSDSLKQSDRFLLAKKAFGII